LVWTKTKDSTQINVWTQPKSEVTQCLLPMNQLLVALILCNRIIPASGWWHLCCEQVNCLTHSTSSHWSHYLAAWEICEVSINWWWTAQHYAVILQQVKDAGHCWCHWLYTHSNPVSRISRCRDL